MSQTIAKIGFIGAGNMGTAIMKAIRSKFDAAEIYAADPDQAKLEALKAFGVQPVRMQRRLQIPVSMCSWQ